MQLQGERGGRGLQFGRPSCPHPPLPEEAGVAAPQLSEPCQVARHGGVALLLGLGVVYQHRADGAGEARHAAQPPLEPLVDAARVEEVAARREAPRLLAALEGVEADDARVLGELLAHRIVDLIRVGVGVGARISGLGSRLGLGLGLGGGVGFGVDVLALAVGFGLDRLGRVRSPRSTSMRREHRSSSARWF